MRVGPWATYAPQVAYSEAESTLYEKRYTFLEAVVEAAEPSGIEADHELAWVAPDTASEIMSHESHAWAIATWRSRMTGMLDVIRK